MRRKRFLLAVLVLALVLSAGVGSAWAYFSANASGAGSRSIRVGGNTRIEEEFGEWTKHVTIRYDDSDPSNTQPVYVRAKVYGPGSYLDIKTVISGDNWKEGADGYWYYKDALSPEKLQADVLDVKIEVKDGDQFDEFIGEGETFTVTVLYESAQVLYDAETGEALPSDTPAIWEQEKLESRDTFDLGEGGE